MKTIIDIIKEDNSEKEFYSKKAKKILENVFDILNGNTNYVEHDFFINNFDLEFDGDCINIYKSEHENEDKPIYKISIK